MIQDTDQKRAAAVDSGLITLFLRMSPEERLLANDHMVRTILELRDAYTNRKKQRIQPERNP